MSAVRRALLPRRLAVVLVLLGLGLAVVLIWSRSQVLWAASLRPWYRFSGWVHRTTNSENVTALTTERDRLRRQVEQLSQLVTQRDQQLSFSQHLDQINDFSALSRHRLINAPVVALNADPGLQTLVLGLGSKDGIRIGQAVTTPSGTVIGKITSLHDHLASVLILTDGQSAIAARLTSHDHSPGVIHGERGLSLHLDFLPKTALVTAGEVVVTAGTESSIPAGLVIGTVSRVTTRAGDVFQTATISWPVEVNDLDVVAVIQS